MNTIGCRILVTGLVQGVGFRPFIHKIAIKHRLSGFVCNTNYNVEIELEGEPAEIEGFMSDLVTEAPALAVLETVQRIEREQPAGYSGFQIVQSRDNSAGVTRISPDVAMCDECLVDMHTMPDRLFYPFTNCINCGPRFSIIRGVPYDRQNTTMDTFILCQSCRAEYEDISNRRYHAQPNACKQCGPQYTFHGSHLITSDLSEVLKESIKTIEAGSIVAFKGMGGFHLCCDAFSETAVSTLRERKKRDTKPFALMFSSLQAVYDYAALDKGEEKALTHHSRPIVLLKKLPQSGKNRLNQLAQGITLGLDTLGVMLPYMGFHHLLFEGLKTRALVLTSGNISNEPIVIDDKLALSKLSGIADAVVTYNREIYNRSDDSVQFVLQEKSHFIRRSRGFVPDPVGLAFNADAILALGGELKNTFALGKGEAAYISQHMGDLTNYDTYCFFRETIERFLELFRVTPELVVCDKHEGYYSSVYARELAIPRLEVQHHHAHITSVMAEHGLEGEVLGICFDGTGAGDDGTSWGSEFFICSYQGYTRKFHFEPVMLPGGDRAVQAGYPVALGYLYGLYGRNIYAAGLDFLKRIPGEEIDLITAMLERKLNSPLSSGAGRLFDGAAVLMGLMLRPGFEAEGPLRLESLVSDSRGILEGRYGYGLDKTAGTIRVLPLLGELIEDLKAQTPPARIAARFHNSLVSIIVETAELLRDETGLSRVALSGGVFQNRYLLEQVLRELSAREFTLYTNHQVPAGDGGLCLGQLAIAAESVAKHS